MIRSCSEIGLHVDVVAVIMIVSDVGCVVWILEESSLGAGKPAFIATCPCCLTHMFHNCFAIRPVHLLNQYKMEQPERVSSSL